MITYPRPMPTARVMSATFEPERVDYLAPEDGGMLGGMTGGFPRWLMTLTFNNMSFREADVLRAWITGQRGSQRQFIAFDPDRQRPAFYATSGRPYQPAPTSWSQAITGDGTATLTLNGLMPGQVVSIGDYVGFSWNGGANLDLARSQEDAQASVAGTVSFSIEPPVPPVVPATAATTLTRAGCLMRLVTKETKLAAQELGYFGAGSVISGAQDLRA